MAPNVSITTEILRTQKVNKPFHTNYLKIVKEDLYNLGLLLQAMDPDENVEAMLMEMVHESGRFTSIEAFIPEIIELFGNKKNIEIVNRVFKDIGNIKRVGQESVYYLFNGIRAIVLEEYAESFVFGILIDTEGSSYLIPNTPKRVNHIGKES